jgi:hypothetical protein
MCTFIPDPTVGAERLKVRYTSTICLSIETPLVSR